MSRKSSCHGLSSRARQKQLYNVDRPVDRFLQYGGDFAVDVTGRAFDLLDAMRAGGDGSDVPLPERFRDVAIQLRAEGGVLPVHRRASGPGAAADQQPRLIVDPFGKGLLLRLPAVGDAPDGSAVWLVGLDGMTQRVATRALFPGLNEPAPQTDVPIVGPVRTASAALFGREDLQAVMTVVDDKDPLLAFGEDGALPPGGLRSGSADVAAISRRTSEPSTDGEAKSSRRAHCRPVGPAGAWFC